MITPEAVFHEFPAKTLRKLTVSDHNLPEKCQEFGNCIQLSVITDFSRFLAKLNKSDNRIHSSEYCFHEIFGNHETDCFHTELFDLSNENELTSL